MAKRKQAGKHTSSADLMDRASQISEDISSRVTDFTGNISDRVSEISESVRSSVENLPVETDIVPRAFEWAPKVITPRVHAWLDMLVTGYFLGVGVFCATRGKGGAATAAFMQAGMVAGVSLMTDYDDTGSKPISFPMHGTMDAVQAATAALAPMLHGFANEPEAMFFYGQAVQEVGVIAMTDWYHEIDEGRLSEAA